MTLLPVILETLQCHQYRAVLEVLGVPLGPSPLVDQLDPEMRQKIVIGNKHILLTHAVCCLCCYHKCLVYKYIQFLLVITTACLFLLR